MRLIDSASKMILIVFMSMFLSSNSFANEKLFDYWKWGAGYFNDQERAQQEYSELYLKTGFNLDKSVLEFKLNAGYTSELKANFYVFDKNHVTWAFEYRPKTGYVSVQVEQEL